MAVVSARDVRKRWSSCEELNSIFAFEPLQNLHFRMPRLLKTSPIQYLSSEEIYSHPRGSPRKQNRFSSVRLPLSKACDDILAHTEEKYLDPSLHLNFPKKKQNLHADGTAQRSAHKKRTAKDDGAEILLCC